MFASVQNTLALACEEAVPYWFSFWMLGRRGAPALLGKSLVSDRRS
jgi:hypothetical protein